MQPVWSQPGLCPKVLLLKCITLLERIEKEKKGQKRQKERKGNGRWNKKEFIFEKQKKFVQTVFYLTWCDDETTILEDDLKCPPWRWPYKESIYSILVICSSIST